MKKLKSILLFFLVLLSSYAFSWGVKGHKIIAEIAKKSLSQPIIDSVQKYLGKMTWEEAAVWMDTERDNPSSDFMKPWHYVNIPKDKTYVKVDEPNVVEALRKSIDILKDKQSPYRSKLNFEIKVLFHLMGDIHQPLHCGYADDKGGNKIEVTFMGKASNLHKVWDSQIIEESNITLNDCLKLANSLTKEEKEQILTYSLESIVSDSRQFLAEVYDFEKNINKKYIDKNKMVIEKQLIKAGFRLAKTLHEIFK